MIHCTYYDLLGVSQNASLQEITNAKTFLIKKFHPDANIGELFDTTFYIQRILEAYRILSDQELRKRYDRRITSPGYQRRHMDLQKSAEQTPDESPKASFAPYWEAANKLNEMIQESAMLEKQQKRLHKFSLSKHLFAKSKTAAFEETEHTSYEEALESLSHMAKPHILLLEEASIPRKYWISSTMNWLLLQWSQNRDLDFHMLFPMYDSYIQSYLPESKRTKLLHESSTFFSGLDKLTAVQ